MGTDLDEHTVVSSDGTRIGTVRVGSGEPLVLVHGAWNWAEHWQPVAEELADDHTCWVMDRRGRGSSGDGDDYSFDRDLAFLQTLPAWEPMVALAPVCVREWDAILDAQLSTDQYRGLSTPTLLLAGSENLDHPSMATGPLSATLPDVRTVVLDGHAHQAHLSDPGLVASEVHTFLTESRP